MKNSEKKTVKSQKSLQPRVCKTKKSDTNSKFMDKKLNLIRKSYGSIFSISLIPFMSLARLRDKYSLSNYVFSLTEIDDDENVIDNIFCTIHLPLFLSFILHYLRNPASFDNSDLVSFLSVFVNSICEEYKMEHFDIPNTHFRIYVYYHE